MAGSSGPRAIEPRGEEGSGHMRALYSHEQRNAVTCDAHGCDAGFAISNLQFQIEERARNFSLRRGTKECRKSRKAVTLVML